MKHIAVIMSTYNGQKFLREQIESIISQKLNDDIYSLTLYVRDDGSSDDTLNILSSYVKSHHIKIIQNSGQNLGIKKSFYSLLESVNADYYFFSDQDDIWHEDKISIFLNRFSQENEKSNLGIYSDLNLVDEHGYNLNKTMMTRAKDERRKSINLTYLVFNYCVTGAAFAINRSTRDFVLKYYSDVDFSKGLMHDAVLGLIIASTGKLVPIKETTVDYRQHSNNVMGAGKKKNSGNFLINKIKTGRMNYFNHLKDIVVLYQLPESELISHKERKVINLLTQLYCAKSFWKRKIILLNNIFSINYFSAKSILWLIIL